MIKLFFKTFLRNIKRNPLSGIINIIGLALGFTVVIISSLWIMKQFSVDKNFKNYDDIYQVMITGTFNGEKSTDRSTPIPLAKLLQSDFKNEMQHITLVSKRENANFKSGEKRITGTGLYAMGAFSELFTFESIKGDVSTPALPSKMIISESLARRLFGDVDVISNVVALNGKEQYQITGVYADLPENSTFHQLDYILPFCDYLKQNPDADQSWGNCFFHTYASIQNPLSLPSLERTTTTILKSKLTDIDPEVLLHPMTKWYLYDDFKNGKNIGGQIQYVWMFALVSALIILLACINFINLSTARSIKRGKEIGILKSIGVNRRQLIQGFLFESILSVFLAFILSLPLILLLLPWINGFIGTELRIPFHSIFFYLIAFLSIVLLGLSSGLYPSLFLSSFNPILALKGKSIQGNSKFKARKIMVVIQFAISIFMMIATYLVITQLNYVKDRPIGYSNKNLVNVTSSSGEIIKKFDVLKKELFDKGLIQNATLSSSFVNNLALTGGGFTWQGNDAKEGSIMGIYTIDENFAPTVQWKFMKGRNFSKDFKTDSIAVILNEAGAKYMGVSDLNSKQLSFRGVKYRILAIIQNTMSESPFESITPTAYFLNLLPKSKITIRLKDDTEVNTTMKAIAMHFTKTDPDITFSYTFTDQDYGKQFKQMEMIRSLTSLFTGLAILISCLGLYALVSFLTEQREKEIGIRKVLGASELGLWKLLSTEYIWLTFIGFMIATPLAYLFMEKWLENYVYRITISWSIFAVTGGLALFITLITVSYQAIKVALSNPIDTLRNE
ncbi:ABC transporter permease [Sphingobacterium sp. JUb56]|uniref:ABC transporter permease n=1 Tax=Sphingobacterium sp. JUb56 TaxID=2587145 RepID=UPI001607BA6D|nr:ABC transporter permease [Sphingobacterium sp. JUb56]MBB2952714.1 ABC-type antimicrobial peptide transport system permease subunit [Sphingobacterium sp. JUb56]